MSLLILPFLLLPFVLYCAPIPILPLRSLHLDRATTQPALVHLSNRSGAILRIHHTDKAISPGLVVDLVAADPGHNEARELGSERVHEFVVSQIFGQIPNEQTKVILRPLRQSGIDPRLPSGRSLGWFGGV